MAKPAYMIIAIGIHDEQVLDAYRDHVVPLVQQSHRLCQPAFVRLVGERARARR